MTTTSNLVNSKFILSAEDDVNKNKLHKVTGEENIQWNNYRVDNLYKKIPS